MLLTSRAAWSFPSRLRRARLLVRRQWPLCSPDRYLCEALSARRNDRSPVRIYFSKARCAPAWSRMPRRLRSPACTTGLPELSGKDLETCQLGNKILCSDHETYLNLRREHIPLIVENPQSSNIWDMPEMVRPARAPDTITVSCHQCQYGCAWKKLTKLLISEGMSGHLLSKVCVPKNGKVRQGRRQALCFVMH